MGACFTCIVASGEVICSVLFAADELLRVEQLAVHTSPHLIDDGGFKVHEHGAWHVLSGSGFTEEGVEGIISDSHSFFTGHLSIGLPKKNTQPTSENQSLAEPSTQSKSITLYSKSVSASNPENQNLKKTDLNAMFKTVKLPTSIAHLDSSLTDVN